MRVAILFCCLHSAIVLCAQSTDTTEVKNGTYWVVQRDAKGIPVNAVVLYDTTGGHDDPTVEKAIDEVGVEYLDLLLDLTGDDFLGSKRLGREIA